MAPPVRLPLTDCCGCSSNSKGTCTCTCETRPISAADRHAKATLIRTATRKDEPLEQQGAAAASAASAAADDGGKKVDTAASATSEGMATGRVDVGESLASNELPQPSDAWETRQFLNRCADGHKILNNSLYTCWGR